MKKISCDVLVVGAGPAGLSAAISSAASGLNVYCIDKKEEIGLPVKCAEGIGKYLLDYMPFKIPKKFFDLKIKGMVFYSNGISIKKKGGFWEGFSINRENFEKWMAELAKSNGAQIILSTALKNLIFDSKKVVNKAVCCSSKGEIIEFFPKFIIAADGVHSETMTFLGEYKKLIGDYARVYSWEMDNLRLKYSNYEQVFFDSFTPKGYAYIFPKGESIANVGVGGVFPIKEMKSYFHDFLSSELVKSQIVDARFVKDKSKDSPFYSVLSNRMIGNVVAIGDAANDNLKPFVEGILPSIIVGYSVGQSILKRKVFQNPLKVLFSQSEDLSGIIKDLYSREDYSKSSLLLCYLIAEVISANEINKLYQKPINELLKLV